MGRGDNDKIKIIKAFFGNPHLQKTIHIGLAAEEEFAILALRKRQGFRQMVIILRGVPAGGSFYGAVPVMIGQADFREIILQGILQYGFRTLLWVVGKLESMEWI